MAKKTPDAVPVTLDDINNGIDAAHDMAIRARDEALDAARKLTELHAMLTRYRIQLQQAELAAARDHEESEVCRIETPTK